MPSPVLLPLASLKSHPRNYRIHPPDQLAHLEESIRTHGFYRNVVASRDGTILVGHGVVMAAARLGMDEVPVITLDMDSTDPRALLLMAADNEIGRLAQTDNAALSKLLESLAKPGPESLRERGPRGPELFHLRPSQFGAQGRDAALLPQRPCVFLHPHPLPDPLSLARSLQ